MTFAICGGRDIRISPLGFTMLDKINKTYHITLLLSGHCHTKFNVDKDAEQWATNNNVIIELYEADWQRYGNGAGPRRNIEMAKILEESGGILIMFAGGRGTRSMRQECIDRVVPVIDLTDDKYCVQTFKSLD